MTHQASLSGTQLAAFYVAALAVAGLLMFATGCSSPQGPGKLGSGNSADLSNPECKLDTDGDNLPNCQDEDADGDGQINSVDTDDDGDGCKDDKDAAPMDPASGCSVGGADEVPIKDECKTSGEWVPLINADGTTGKNLSDCLKARTFDETIDVEVFWCSDHQDALILSGTLMYFRSYSKGRGDIGAFAGMHSECANEYKDKAIVKIVRNGQTKTTIWYQPAFSAINLDIPDLDPSSATGIPENPTQLVGRNSLQYFPVNNNLGPGALTHILRFEDTNRGSETYGVSIKYQFNRRQVGTYR